MEPVYWQRDGWFKVGSDGTSRIEFDVDKSFCTFNTAPAPYPEEKWSITPKTACYIRCPDYDNYKFGENGEILLRGTAQKLNGRGNVTFIGDRQHEFECTAALEIDAKTVKGTVKCGLTAYMDENNHYDLIVSKADDKTVISGVINVGGVPVKMNEITVSGDRAELLIKTTAQSYKLYGKNKGEWLQLAAMESKYLSCEVCEGFTGVVIGIFCEDSSDNGEFVSFTVK